MSESTGNIILDDIKRLVEANGDRVDKDEPTCLIHRADHKDCKDCPSSLGCCKTAAIGLVIAMGSLIKHTNVVSMLESFEQSSQLVDQILKAKTTDEAKAVLRMHLHG